MKICRDCFHVHVIVTDSTDGQTIVAKCHHPKAIIEVTRFYDGTTRTSVPTVDTMRMIGPCGVEGKLFEPREG